MRKAYVVRKSVTAFVLASLLAWSVAACASYAAQEDELAMAYLKKAQKAVQAKDAETATANLYQAENAWLGANYPYENPQINTDPDALRDIGRAIQSVRMGLWGDADYYIRTAMTHPSAIQPIRPFWDP